MSFNIYVMKKFAFLLCLFIHFQFVEAQDRFDSILHSKKLDIDLRCIDFGSSKKITGYTLIIESKDSTKKYQLDSLSSKLVTTLSFGRIYTLTVSKKNFEPKSIIIDLLDGISAKEMPFLLKRTKNIYYPIAFNLIPTAYLLSSQKDLFNKLGSVGRIYYSCKNHDVDNDENFGKKILACVFMGKKILEKKFTKI